MAYPKYLRESARKMRRERHLTIDELAYRPQLPRTTIYYWVRDLPIPTTANQTAAARRAGQVTRRKHQKFRNAAYARGLAEFDALVQDPTFRDLVVLYVGEGSKRSRNDVGICNSDFRVMKLAKTWLDRLTDRPLKYSFQHHADQDPRQVQQFWGEVLEIDPDSIKFQRKSNSGQMSGRRWRSRHGVLAIRVSDTYLRSRIQAWIDRLNDEWMSPIDYESFLRAA